MFRARGINTLALPSWEFDALCEGSALCHRSLQSRYPIIANVCAETSGLAIPITAAPFHVHGILFSRVSTLRFAEFLRCAQVLHEQIGEVRLSESEKEAATAGLLATLFRDVKKLQVAELVVKHLAEYFPPPLVPYLPPPGLLGANRPVLIQLALARQGVSAESVQLGMCLTGPFVEIRLKIALVLAQAGASIRPPEACWNRWVVETASSNAEDAVSRFIALCDYGNDRRPFPTARGLRSLPCGVCCCTTWAPPTRGFSA